MNNTRSQKSDIRAQRKVGVFGLTMIIISALIGGGAFNIPQNMSADAGTGANLIAWCITATGMWFVANMFRILSEARPEATDGIYTYGQMGFGNLTGFISAWGYWVAGFVGHVAYAVLLMSTFDYFFPGVKNRKWEDCLRSLPSQFPLLSLSFLKNILRKNFKNFPRFTREYYFRFQLKMSEKI